MAFQPEIFGDYFLLERIGAGGMAEIFRGRRFGAAGFEREVAVKRVLRRFTDDPEFLEMLTNEAKLSATLQHGNIVQVYDLGLVKGTYFIVMEFVEGVTLKQLMRAMSKAGIRFSPVEAAYLVQQIAEGLDYAHRKTDPTGQPLGIVHCDISPDNILLTPDGQVKVGDFGIARAAASFSNYKEGMVMGKLNYLSPEQARGQTPDHRADIFSMGILLYQLVTGVHPFGQKGSMETLVRIGRLKRGELAPPETHDPTVPKVLGCVAMRALEPEPGARYSAARAMAHELTAYLYPATPLEVQSMIETRIHEHFGAHLAARAETRSRDAEIIRDLQRRRAEALAAETRTEPTAEPAATRAPEGAQGRPSRSAGAVVGAGVLIGLLVGLAAGWVGSRMLSPPPHGVLFVDSVPRGAVVRLEHRERGTTPLVLPVEGERAYLLEVEAPGHQPVRETFEVDRGAIVEKRYALEERRAPLEIVSVPPGAVVSIDGEEVGRTPLVREMPAGRTYQVEVRRGRASRRQEVVLGDGGLTLRFEFK